MSPPDATVHTRTSAVAPGMASTARVPHAAAQASPLAARPLPAAAGAPVGASRSPARAGGALSAAVLLAAVLVVGGAALAWQGSSLFPAGIPAAWGGPLLGPALAGLGLVLGAGALLLRRVLTTQGERTRRADALRQRAELHEADARRLNHGNQAAILRLMNELQRVAEGDLTQQATVSEDITGAIADTVNYTVEELRRLVAQVQRVAAQLRITTDTVQDTSTELLAASGEQLHEIQSTGQAVLGMATRITAVSDQAQKSAQVAAQSLTAARSGHAAVTASMEAMSQLRERIQDTAKRIKRLGESSQEIGEITQWITGLTDQTQVLALNAAIQATAAGEAGRGFSVIAEEVQRLAERSGQATAQIAQLVQTTQQDTHNAVVAMEQAIQSVVRNAQLSDAAGTALADIDRVSRELAALIEAIAAQTRQEADSATVVASHIEHIFAVTEQTSEGTRTTAHTVRELARMASELKQSVERFKIK